MTRLLIYIFIIATLAGCSKTDSSDNNIDIRDVTGISWQIFAVQRPTDFFISPIPYPWYFKLSNDRSFTFTLHNSVSSGTYSWVQSDSINAKIHFNIQNWNAAIADTQYTNKLKEILQGIDSCHYLKPPNLLPVPVFLDPPSMELQFYGDKGHFNVYVF